MAARAAGRRPPRPAAARALAATRRALTDRHNRRWVVLGALALAGLIAFGIYVTVAGPSPRVEAVVYFTPTATDAQKDAVRAACPTSGGAVQEPPDHNTVQSSRVYPLRYNITFASPADRAAVYRCVHAQSNVIGISEFTQGQ
ncbi:hypothetical protein [Frankia sp. CiP1_Cm_nod1]|uniref:hypothetical protein n=1 Tax=Frankia sp. CiP1_Cm_nod1 TaxID=2897160 RepID=UPI0040441B8D